MSATELERRVLPIATERSLSGWGRMHPSRARVLRPGRAQELPELLGSQEVHRGGVIARGAGRSYGDAAQNEGGAVIDMMGLRAIHSIDEQRRRVRAEGGATLDELLRTLARKGMMLPVVPGTRHVTVAGAIASDIHGKNHHRDGGMARHVESLTLCTPAGELLELSPDSDGDLFYATLGGMGLTGVVTEATLRTVPLPPCVIADTDRTDGLEQTLELMAAEDGHRYSVAWLDMLAGGARMGRAIVSRSDPLAAPAVDGRPAGGDDRARQGMRLRGPLLEVPRRFPGFVLRPSAVLAFNELRWRAAPRVERGRELALAPYFFPLDVLGEWNRLYGPAGFLQYQFVVPIGAEQALRASFELFRRHRLPVYLAVFKRMGASFGGPLSFPLEGWTLAVDIPAGAPGLASALDELDGLIAGCGGRVYLSKDIRLRPDLLGVMYPELERFRELRTRVDPEGVLRSDLALRLGLCEGSRAPARALREGPARSEEAGSSGRRVLVLGGTSEIALAIVRELQRGAPREVALVGRDMDALEQARLGLEAAGCPRVLTLQLDALETEQHAGVLDDALEQLGGADITILAVGQLGERGGMPSEIADAVDVLRVNLAGSGSLLMHAAKGMRERGGGALVVLSSVAAERPRRGNAVYGASKAGLDALAQSLGDDLHEDGVRVLVVRPGFVRTRMTEGLDPAPLSTTPDAVAKVVVQGLDRGASTVWAPPALRWLMLVVRMLPRSIIRRMRQ
jgi:decaprenylphospho-beta-D-ribofuranose 2-oxidase